MTCPFTCCPRRAAFRLGFDWPHILVTAACPQHRDHLRLAGWAADREAHIAVTSP
jgi:hypothetical protein